MLLTAHLVDLLLLAGQVAAVFDLDLGGLPHIGGQGAIGEAMAHQSAAWKPGRRSRSARVIEPLMAAPVAASTAGAAGSLALRRTVSSRCFSAAMASCLRV